MTFLEIAQEFSLKNHLEWLRKIKRYSSFLNIIPGMSSIWATNATDDISDENFDLSKI